MNKRWRFGDVSVEVSGPRPWFGWQVSTDPGNRQATVALYCGLLLWVTVPWPSRRKDHHERRTGVEVTWDGDVAGGEVRVQARIASTGDWYREQEAWPLRRRVTEGAGVTWSLGLLDALLGPARYEERPAPQETAWVDLPKGRYQIHATVRQVRWLRPRWPWRPFSIPWVWRASVDAPDGIPHPGKGENSWDCGDDATFGVTFAIERDRPSLETVCQRVTDDVLRLRERRGGKGWVPARGGQ